MELCFNVRKTHFKDLALKLGTFLKIFHFFFSHAYLEPKIIKYSFFFPAIYNLALNKHTHKKLANMNFINDCYQRFCVKIELKNLKLAGTNKIIYKDANHRPLIIFAFIEFLTC
jgi:hypothetical protein